MLNDCTAVQYGRTGIFGVFVRNVRREHGRVHRDFSRLIRFQRAAEGIRNERRKKSDVQTEFTHVAVADVSKINTKLPLFHYVWRLNTRGTFSCVKINKYLLDLGNI